MLSGRVGYEPHGKQKRIHVARDCGAKYVFMYTGRRFGKSFTWGVEGCTDLAFGPTGLQSLNTIKLFAPTKSLTDAIFEPVYKWIVDRQIFGCAPRAKSTRERYIEMPWGARVDAKTTENTDGLRSSGDTAIYSDEHAFGDDIFTEYLEAPLADLDGFLGISTTPQGENHAHKLYELFTEEMNNGNPRYFTQCGSSYDNPHIDHNRLDESRARAVKTGNLDLWEQEVLGKPGAMKGAVYPMFDPGFHVREITPNRDVPMRSCYDWGFQNPFAGLAFQVLEDDCVYIYREIYQSGLDDDEKARLATNMLDSLGCQRGMGYGDPSSPAAIKTFRKNGISMWEPQDSDQMKRLNSVLDGISAVRSLLSRRDKPGIVIHPECEYLIKEIKNYRFKEPGASGKEAVVKENDHAADALRYGVVGAVGNAYRSPFIFAA